MSFCGTPPQLFCFNVWRIWLIGLRVYAEESIYICRLFACVCMYECTRCMSAALVELLLPAATFSVFRYWSTNIFYPFPFFPSPLLRHYLLSSHNCAASPSVFISEESVFAIHHSPFAIRHTYLFACNNNGIFVVQWVSTKFLLFCMFLSALYTIRYKIYNFLIIFWISFSLSIIYWICLPFFYSVCHTLVCTF